MIELCLDEAVQHFLAAEVTHVDAEYQQPRKCHRQTVADQSTSQIRHIWWREHAQLTEGIADIQH